MSTFKSIQYLTDNFTFKIGPAHSLQIYMLNTNVYLVETTRIKSVTSRIKVGYLYLATGLAPMDGERSVLFNDTVNC